MANNYSNKNKPEGGNNFKSRNTKSPYKGKPKGAPTNSSKGDPKEVVSSISGGNPRLGLTNAAYVTDTHAAIEVAVTDKIVDVSDIIDLAFGMTSLDVQSVIDAYAATRGLPTTLTSTVVKNYIIAATNYFAGLIATLRAENQAQVVTQRGFKIGALLNNYGVIDPLDPTGLGTITAITYGVSSISNAVWANNYLRGLSKTKLPQGIVGLILQFFGVIYSTAPYSDLGNDAMLQLKPSGDVRLFTTTNLTAMEALLSANPDLLPVIGLLGFDGDAVNALDFSRDLKGQTVAIVNSPDMIHMLANSQIFHPRKLVDRTVSGDQYVDYVADDTSSLGCPIMAETQDDAILPLLLRYSQVEMGFLIDYITKVIVDGTVGTVAMTHSLPPGVFHATGTFPHPGIFGALSEAWTKWNQAVAIPMGSNLTYSYSEPDDQPTITVVERAYNTEGCNTYVFNSLELELYAKVAANALLFGVNWRQDLTGLIRGMASRISNIKY